MKFPLCASSRICNIRGDFVTKSSWWMMLGKVRFLIMRTAYAQIRAFHAHHTSRATNFNSKLEFARPRFAFFKIGLYSLAGKHSIMKHNAIIILVLCVPAVWASGDPI
eukprot:sb/3477613/